VLEIVDTGPHSQKAVPMHQPSSHCCARVLDVKQVVMRAAEGMLALLRSLSTRNCLNARMFQSSLLVHASLHELQGSRGWQQSLH
jgi:hypothetical protein